MTRLLRCLACLLVLRLGLVTPAAAEVAAILVDDSSASALEFARLLESDLAHSHPGLKLQRITHANEVPGAARLLVAVGTRSLQQAAGLAKAPRLVGALVPSGVFEEVAPRGRATAVFLDQPAVRQLALLSLLLPEAKRIGVLISPGQRKALAPLAQAADAIRLQLQISVVENRDGLFEALQQLTAKSDALLAWPDTAVFNPQTIQSILLTTYRQHIPMFGFSAAYTKAGALASVHSSVPQLAVQTADLVRAALSSGPLPPPQYPREFEITVNRQVARSLGIALPDESRLAEQVIAREAKLRP
jgi:putative tryptophan/tyrosine transport system substrate-binding protein